MMMMTMVITMAVTFRENRRKFGRVYFRAVFFGMTLKLLFSGSATFSYKFFIIFLVYWNDRDVVKSQTSYSFRIGRFFLLTQEENNNVYFRVFYTHISIVLFRNERNSKSDESQPILGTTSKRIPESRRYKISKIHIADGCLYLAALITEGNGS